MPNPTATTAAHTRAQMPYTQALADTQTAKYERYFEFSICSPVAFEQCVFPFSRQPPPLPPSPSSPSLYARPLSRFQAVVWRINCGKSGACVREIPIQEETWNHMTIFQFFHRAIRDRTAGASTMLPFSSVCCYPSRALVVHQFDSDSSVAVSIVLAYLFASKLTSSTAPVLAIFTEIYNNFKNV